MTTTAAPQMPTAVDLLADRFVEDFAPRIAPIQHYVAAKYPTDHLSTSFAMLSEQEKIATITVVSHAVRFCEFRNVFEHRRAASEGIRLALGRLSTTDEIRHDFRAVYASMIGHMSSALAATYVPDPSDDDSCYCGQPDCGAC